VDGHRGQRAELNTPFTTIEVFRKILRKESNRWDLSALIVSLIGTMANLLITFSTRISLPNAWQWFVLNWGPLIAGFAVACDYYGALVELGFLFGSFEMRMERWLEDRQTYNQAHGLEPSEPLPKAGIDDWREMTRGLNGKTPTTVRGAVELMREHGFKRPSKQTVGIAIPGTGRGDYAGMDCAAIGAHSISG
jgi:hypothetical protein